MTEDQARAWLCDRFGTFAVDRVAAYVDLLLTAAAQQNLISAGTVPSVWARHIVDSAQLIDHAPANWQHWVDIGAGAGLPGLVVATLSGRRVTMIEPRKLRVDFLDHCINRLGLDGVSVIAAKAERVGDIQTADVVSARAVAKLDNLLRSAHGFATRDTVFVLPKGISAQSEVAAARRSWHGRFHVEHSIVDPASGIVVATQVAPR